MPASDIIVSYVVTVFNKEPYIGHTVDSLLRQEGGIPAEYIFVDDVSADRSLEVIEARTRDTPNVTIIKNSRNAGPSIRLNQGARIARGRFLQFIDSDDILAANASRLMLQQLEKHRAEVVYGRWEKTNADGAALVGRRIAARPGIEVSDAPLQLVLSRRVLRMTQMVEREMFLTSGGCDERIFIQDEALPLRLARVVKRFALMDTPVVFVPKVEGVLSNNIAQCNHDRFLANRNMLIDFPDLEERYRRLLYRRCVSAAWKQHRLMKGDIRACITPVFLHYLRSKLLLLPVDREGLDRMSRFFSEIKGVRRVSGGGF